MMELDLKRYEEKLQGEKPMLVEFQAPWCIYCRRIAPALARVAAQYAGHLEVGTVNIDLEPALADREGIEVVPTLVIYQGGEAIGSIVAPESKARIEDFIRDHLDI